MSKALWTRLAILAATLAVPSGCGGFGASPAQPPLLSRIVSPAINTSDNLTYIADYGADVVDIYDFLDRAGQLTGFKKLAGLCVDGRQNVFVLDRFTDIASEYAHAATKPEKSLNDRAGDLFACASDPLTGNLAVTNDVSTGGSRPGNVLVFTKASGTPREYSISGVYSYGFAAYDSLGNLYVDGRKTDGAGVVAELSKGASAFKTLDVNVSIDPGAQQWVGGQLCIVDLGVTPQAIDHFKIAGTKATKTVSTPLDADSYVASFFVAAYASGDVLYATNQKRHEVGLWRYPKGGKAGLFIDRLDEPLSVVLSRGEKLPQGAR